MQAVVTDSRGSVSSPPKGPADEGAGIPTAESFSRLSLSSGLSAALVKTGACPAWGH